MNQHSPDISIRIRSLLDRFRSGLSVVTVVEVEEYLEQAEYGLALDTLIALLVQSGMKVTADEYAELIGLHHVMELNPDQSQWLKLLGASCGRGQ